MYQRQDVVGMYHGQDVVADYVSEAGCCSYVSRTGSLLLTFLKYNVITDAVNESGASKWVRLKS